MKIVVLDGFTLNPGDNAWSAVKALGDFTVYDRTPAAEIIERAKDADIILTNKTPLTAQTLAELPNLKFIAVLATGFNVVDTEAAKERGIPVSNVPIYGTDAVAQFVFAQILSLSHRIELHSDLVHKGDWTSSIDFCFWKTPLVELVGKTIGIIGFGRIGRRVGEIASAFGMNVKAHDLYHGDEPTYNNFSWAEVNDIFATSDVVSLNCPLTEENTGLVNEERLSMMKPTAILVNAARGPLINEEALAKALTEDKIAGAALDVVSTEPIAADNPLLGVKNCLITPHIAWATLEARARLMQTTADNVAAFIASKPINVVNGL